MESLHLLQARYWDSPLSSESARLFVQRKCFNMSHLLDAYHVYREKVHFDDAGHLRIASQKILNTKTNIASVSDRTRLLLVEGRATQIYWSVFSVIAKQEHWKRIYPHATDQLNSALNIGYTMLANMLRERIKSHGLSCEIGVLHTPRRYKEALLYDFEELFRQPVIDAAILPLFSRKKSIHGIDQKYIIKAVLNHCEKRIHYHDSQWHMKAVLDSELELFISALKNKKVYIPYKHSWSHWSKK